MANTRDNSVKGIPDASPVLPATVTTTTTTIETTVIPTQVTPSIAPVGETVHERRVRLAQDEARLIQVLDRGIVADRLYVPLPPGVHGEWARNEQIEIDRMKMMGFEIDTKYANNRGLHNNGTGATIVGDVIFMTTTQDNKNLINKIYQERFERINGKRGAARTQKEESDFRTATDKLDMPVIHESSQSVASTAEILAALEQPKI